MSDDKMFKQGQKVYWTKYGLTAGVQIREVDNESSGLIRLKRFPGEFTTYANQKDLFDNLDDALNEVEKLREKKLASLRKQIDKVTNLKVKVK